MGEYINLEEISLLFASGDDVKNIHVLLETIYLLNEVNRSMNI